MHRVAVIVAALVLLTGCSPFGDDTDDATGARHVAGLDVEGSFGAVPVLRFPPGDEPGARRREVVEAGGGAAVRPGDLLVVDYLGQFWAGEVFDDTFAKPGPSAFPLTEGSFFPGFSEAMTGTHVGDRVVVVVPPPAKAIEQAKTFVFVIDVIAAYGLDTPPSHGADPTDAATPIDVTGEPLRAPTVSIPAGMQEPPRPTTTILARGRGEPVRDGLVVLALAIVDWNGQETKSSWKEGTLTSARVEEKSPSPMVDAIRGVPLGSRVLVQLPPQTRDGKRQPASAVVIDVIEQPSRP